MSALTQRVRTVATARASQVGELASGFGFELIKIASVAVIFPIVAPALGPDGYGEYTTLYVLAGLASTWVSGAGGAAMVQLILQRSRQVDSVMMHGRRQLAAYSVPFSVLGVGASVLLFGGDILVPALFVFGSDLVINGLATVNTSAVFATRGVASSYRLQAITPALRTVGVVVLWATGQVTLLNLVVLASVVSAIAYLASRRVARGLERLDRDDATPTNGKELHRLTLTYSATISANAVQDEGEKVVLASYRPTSEVGEYQAAYRLIGLSLVPLRPISIVATRWALAAVDVAGGQLRRARRLSVVVGSYGLIVGLVALLARPLVEVILGDQYVLASTMFVWLAGFPLVRALADIPVVGLIGLNCNRERMLLGLSGAALALISYVVLIPMWGWRGAVVGTYVSEVFTLLGGWILLVIHQRRADARRSPGESEGAADNARGEETRPSARG